MANQLGRPTLYTEKLAEEICDVVSSSNEGLSSLCKARSHWPDRTNIYVWLRKYPDFRSNYTQAKKEQTHAYVDEVYEMMHEDHHYVDDNGNIRIDSAMLRLKLDHMKWHCGKLNAHVYGKAADEVTDNSLSKSVLEGLISKLVE